ncbi:glycosyltransferase family 2 protein [Terrihabitans sp. B22-R8]|uniref:glycosyltransferase family 2 protein n=1 Tax=Terrihabitans sp. B22-R8 TaxID=3425128 RepID=UPI00403C2984
MSASTSATISVVVPARNEALCLDTLIDEIHIALGQESHEIIIVDDGSTDDTATVLSRKTHLGMPVRHIRHIRSLGQSAAVRTGVLNARGEIVVTLDGDGQNDPAYIPQLLNALRNAGSSCGLAMGQRKSRTDSAAKRVASRFANAVRQKILHDNAADSGCGLKAVPRDLFRQLPFFDGWHRFIPALVHREGYDMVRVEVTDRPRSHGRSNYGIFDRGLRGVLDLAGMWWLMRRFRGRADATEIE